MRPLSLPCRCRSLEDFANKFVENLKGGDVTVAALAVGPLSVDGAFNYNSAHKLTLTANKDAIVNASILNGGSGELVLVIDTANSQRPNYNSAASLQISPTATLSSGGAIRIFATEPAHTQLGGYTPPQRRYNSWFGDAVTVAGVNFKFQPTLTLTVADRSKTYGQVLTFAGNEFTVAGLQPGDLLAQVLAGTPVLTSSGAAATAQVSGSP